MSAIQEIMEAEQLTNSLTSLCGSLSQSTLYGYGGAPGNGPQISQANTLFANNRWYLISNLRQLISQIYVEHGLVQTLVDQPVDDAFRAGFEIKTGQLDGDEIEDLVIFAERNRVIHSVMQAIKWGRLYGGGGVLIYDGKPVDTPLEIESINQDTPLKIESADMWELYFSYQNTVEQLLEGNPLESMMGDHYDYYGHPIHKSRVLRVVGKEPPAFIRPRLRGWGMSELERVVRSMNQYLKNQDVIFELLDEAKIDVFKINGFNSALLTPTGTQGISQRVQMANMIKNYNHALTMDSQDDYAQKQITFTGLAEVLMQIRQGIAADLKMPMTKLFGVSAAGFSSGEDDIENYNSMIEGEIRQKNRYILHDVLTICCRKVFGMMPDDLQVIFNPLRILNAKEEEEVKTSQFNRMMSAYQSGLITAQEAKEGINKDSLLPIEINEASDALPPLEGDFTVTGEAAGKGGKQAKAEA